MQKKDVILSVVEGIFFDIDELKSLQLPAGRKGGRSD